MVRVLFVCMGNICRSPTAQGVFEQVLAEMGLADQVAVDSAGTHAYHVGEPPDPRAVEAARRRGVSMDSQRARRVTEADFLEYDYILAMDESNRADLLEQCLPGHEHKIRLFMEFSELEAREVPDPYYGGRQGFERVLDLVEDAARGLARHLVEIHGLRPRSEAAGG